MKILRRKVPYSNIFHQSVVYEGTCLLLDSGELVFWGSPDPVGHKQQINLKYVWMDCNESHSLGLSGPSGVLVQGEGVYLLLSYLAVWQKPHSSVGRAQAF